jgi:hypothetical protein
MGRGEAQPQIIEHVEAFAQLALHLEQALVVALRRGRKGEYGILVRHLGLLGVSVGLTPTS